MNTGYESTFKDWAHTHGWLLLGNANSCQCQTGNDKCEKWVTPEGREIKVHVRENEVTAVTGG